MEPNSLIDLASVMANEFNIDLKLMGSTINRNIFTLLMPRVNAAISGCGSSDLKLLANDLIIIGVETTRRARMRADNVLDIFSIPKILSRGDRGPTGPIMSSMAIPTRGWGH